MEHSIFVHNIKCGGCAKSITNKINALNGVSDTVVNVEEGNVRFSTNDDSAIDKVKVTLKNMGYPEGDPTTLETAKSYVNCMIGRMSK